MLACEGLGKRYGAAWVFRRVALEVEKGSCLLVTGPNGSGKSTLLKTLAGLEPPSEGVLQRQFDLRRGLGYTSTDLRLYPQLTGSEHISFAATLRGVAAHSNALADVGLSGHEDKQVGAYSTGMRGRLKLALATMGPPDLLILDEPGAGMDEEGRSLVEEIVARQRTTGALIIATNDPAERRFGDFELRLLD